MKVEATLGPVFYFAGLRFFFAYVINVYSFAAARHICRLMLYAYFLNSSLAFCIILEFPPPTQRDLEGIVKMSQKPEKRYIALD